MAFEEELAVCAKLGAIEAKLEEVMRLSMLATQASLASGGIALSDPGLKAVAKRGVAHGLATVRNTAASVEELTREAAQYVAVPGAEALAAAMRRRLANAELLLDRADEFVTFNRALASLAAEEAAARRRRAVARARKPNAKYYGPQWSN